jgi:hypothetical protein
MAKLFAAEEEAAKEAQTIVAKLRTITDDKGDVEDTKKLRDALARQFDAQQQRRALEIGKIEERLGKLKDTMKRRDAAKDTIIGRRVDELKGVTDDLGWEETIAPNRNRLGDDPYSIPRYSIPNTVPAPGPPSAFPGNTDRRPSR